MKTRSPFIIVIAAVSGGGKTTVTTNLSTKLSNSHALYFDDYNFEGPDNLMEWIERGGDPNEWDLSPLLNDLRELFKRPLSYILIDFPFAYGHSQMSEFIDLAVFIDTPLDIAMARRFIRDFKNKSTDYILAEMSQYISSGRQGYLHMHNSIKPNSDLTVDGLSSVEEIMEKISAYLEGRRKDGNVRT